MGVWRLAHQSRARRPGQSLVESALAPLFGWLSPAEYQLFAPLATQGSNPLAADAATQSCPVLLGSYRRPGLDPGWVITGTTLIAWPAACPVEACGVWAQVDPTFLDLGIVCDWYGYNPEGLNCGQGADGLPVYAEERNNITAYFPVIDLAFASQGYSPGGRLHDCPSTAG